jgi:hypothetical protein
MVFAKGLRNASKLYIDPAMPQLDLESDALALLRLEARKDAGDLSACIRRLIEEAHRKKPGKRITVDQLRIPVHLTPEALAAIYPTAILRFMYLLGWLSKTHKSDFAMVQHYTGRGRVYFAKNPEVILESGSSTMPQRIPGHDIVVRARWHPARVGAALREGATWRTGLQSSGAPESWHDGGLQRQPVRRWPPAGQESKVGSSP